MKDKADEIDYILAKLYMRQWDSKKARQELARVVLNLDVDGINGDDTTNAKVFISEYLKGGETVSVILGIDNGLDGGIAIVREDGSINTLVLIPVVEEKRPGKNGKQKTVRRYDESAIAEYFRNVKESNAGKLKAYIESAQAFPGQGVVATFSTGYGYGLYRGILTALGIPYEVVRPQAWQKGFSIPAGAGKGGAYNVAARLFPGAHFHTVRGRLLDGLVDAALIAEYGRRKTNGTVA